MRHATAFPIDVEEPKEVARRTVSYSDNFRANRATPWTH